MNKKQSQKWLGVLILFFLFIFFGFVLPEYRDAQRYATYSAEASIIASIERLHPTVRLDDDCKVLSDAEFESLLATLENEGASIDACPSCHAGSGVVADAWGHRLQIKGRRLENDTSEFVIRSSGLDGIYGNDDDIVVSKDQHSIGNEPGGSAGERMGGGLFDLAAAMF